MTRALSRSRVAPFTEGPRAPSRAGFRLWQALQLAMYSTRPVRVLGSSFGSRLLQAVHVCSAHAARNRSGTDRLKAGRRRRSRPGIGPEEPDDPGRKAGSFFLEDDFGKDVEDHRQKQAPMDDSGNLFDGLGGGALVGQQGVGFEQEQDDGYDAEPHAHLAGFNGQGQMAGGAHEPEQGN